MQITKDKVASILYTLRDGAGNLIESNEGREPMTYMHGTGSVIVGMEEGLEGKSAGDKFKIKVLPEKGYGEKDSNLIQKGPRAAFGNQKIEKGMQFQTNQGQVVTVTETGLEAITVDGNHPLAGVELHFDVEVTAVRAATQEEISHGHVHGPDGHHHH
jgi:FKBP-type peptidyl-prolyl cis-trans isomerase SlyD